MIIAEAGVYTQKGLRDQLATLLADQLGVYKLPHETGLAPILTPSIWIGEAPKGTDFQTRKLEVIIGATPVLDPQQYLDSVGAIETWQITLRQLSPSPATTHEATLKIYATFPDVRIGSYIPADELVEEQQILYVSQPVFYSLVTGV